MTKFFYKPRGGGKTTAMIYTSAITGYPIIANSHQKASFIANKAKEMELSIPDPLTSEEVRHGALRGTGVTDALIDDAEGIIETALKEYLGVQPVGVTLTLKE